MFKKLLRHFNGLHYTQEYLCLAKESFVEPLHVYLLQNEKPVQEITDSHTFVGYCPLVFALSSSIIPAFSDETIDIGFYETPLSISNDKKKSKSLALLQL